MRGGGRKSGSDSAPKSAPAAVSYDDAQPLNLGAALKACDEHDLVRKGTSRKGRYLMVLPLHLSIEQSGAIGTFTHMDTAHPKLVIPTADGHLELEGSFVNTSTSYLVCNCQPRKDHSTCEHVFNQLLVFSDPVLNTSPTTTTTAVTTTTKQEAAANGENEEGGAEMKEKEVAPLAPFYGVSDRPPIKVAKRRSSAGASQSAKKRKRSYSGGTSEEEDDDEETATAAATKRKPKRRGSDDDDDDEQEDADTSDEDAYVDKSFKATPKAGAPRRQSLRAVKVVDYSAFDVSEEEEEEAEGDEEDGEEGEEGGEDDEEEAGEEEEEDDDQADVDEVAQLDVLSDEN